MILAILLAKATAASLTGLRAMIRPSQLSAKFSLPRDYLIVDMAPTTRSLRMVRSPIFVMWPNRSLPPLEF
jgi:anion-transporting  ArsA/GET3 family ATPase